MNTQDLKTTLHKFVLFSLVIASGSVSGFVQATSENSKNWQFKVFLDGDEIGSHSFSVIDKNQHREIYSKAKFNIKFLFFNAYSYQHDDVEQWSGNCLQSINAVTNDNGDEYNVSGKIDESAFIVKINDKQSSYQACVKTFAYWDPSFLKETTLLNSQTGEMVDVQSELIGNESVTYNGEVIKARRYRISGKALRIDLWYSDDDNWLALESITEGGRVVRYAIP